MFDGLKSNKLPNNKNPTPGQGSYRPVQSPSGQGSYKHGRVPIQEPARAHTQSPSGQGPTRVPIQEPARGQTQISSGQGPTRVPIQEPSIRISDISHPVYSPNNKHKVINYIKDAQNFDFGKSTRGTIKVATTEKEFYDNINKKTIINLDKKIDLSNNIHKQLNEKADFDKYANQTPASVEYTFKYLFNKFKKCIYVKIIDNKLNVFLPFSNAFFLNEWHDKVKIDPKFTSVKHFLENLIDETNKIQNTRYIFNTKKVHLDIKNWYANNCIFRYDKIDHENNLEDIKNMFESLCQHRDIPDMEFFINKRDFPLLKNNGMEAYDNIWGDDTPLVSHSYPSYCPILSMVSGNSYADIPIPTYSDWTSLSATANFSTPWSEKKEIAIFRGSMTGCGHDIDTNIRLKAAYMSMSNKNVLDAGITKWNARPRKLKNNEYLKIPEINAQIPLVEFMSYENQSKYKYILNIDGHVSAFRLSNELGMGSVVLLVNSTWKLWYSHLLQPYEHYIPVNSDLSNLLEIIDWCKSNDKTCKKIAENAKKFSELYLCKNSMFDYMQKLFIDLNASMKKSYALSRFRIDNFNIRNNGDMRKIIEAMKVKDVEKAYSGMSRILPVNFADIEAWYTRNYGFLSAYRYLYLYMGLINLNLFTMDKNTDSYIILSETEQIFYKNINNYMFTITLKLDHGEILHEAFTGLNVINNICRLVPNFSFVYGMEYADSLLSEAVVGPDFEEYINSESFDILNYFKILSKICLALDCAQKNNCFVHSNLLPKNIIITKDDKSYAYKFYDKEKSEFRIAVFEMNLNPIILDYSKSHFFHNNIRYGNLDEQISLSKDIRDIVLSTSYLVLSRSAEIDSLHVNIINNMIRYFIKPEYHNFDKYPAVESAYEDKRPVDLFKFIEKHVQVCSLRNYNSESLQDILTIMDSHVSASSAFDIIISSTTTERCNICLNSIKNFKKKKVATFDNLFLTYYSKNRIIQTLKSWILYTKFYLSSNNMSTPTVIRKSENIYFLYKNIFNKLISSKTITDLFSTRDIENLKKIEALTIASTIFTDLYVFNREKTKIKNMKMIDIPYSIYGYYDIILSVFTDYEFSYPHKLFYTQTLSEFLNLDFEKLLINLAYIKYLISWKPY